MPKQKTHKGLAKRVKVTGTGKVKGRRPGGNHLMSTKNGKRSRKISSSMIILDVYARKMKEMLCR